ncbi:hypothetical protein K440DRAFT_635495, partial [Wilcoxina mikolae CBS 423.85]
RISTKALLAAQILWLLNPTSGYMLNSYWTSYGTRDNYWLQFGTRSGAYWI